MAFTPEQHKAYRMRLRADSICIRCRRVPAMAGKALCRKCRESSNEHRRKKREDKTICYDCNKPMNEFELAIGVIRCTACAQKNSERKVLNRW